MQMCFLLVRKTFGRGSLWAFETQVSHLTSFLPEKLLRVNTKSVEFIGGQTVISEAEVLDVSELIVILMVSLCLFVSLFVV